MTKPMPSFHLFRQLPTELRQQTWQYCLPHRVLNSITHSDTIVFWLDREDKNLLPSPCTLRHTTRQKPLISRVCRESRSVATRSGGFVTDRDPDRPSDTEWYSDFEFADAWVDKTRGAPHLNCTAVYEGLYQYYGNPLNCMIWEAQRFSATPSITFGLQNSREFATQYYRIELPDGRFDCTMPKPDNKIEFVNAFKQVPSWLVVMDTIVVQSDLRSAAATGLFGLLGDAPVQIIPISEETKINSFYNLAERCERGRNGIAPQDFTRKSADEMRQELRREVWLSFRSEDLAAIMHPAIMFRLCTQMCNHSVEAHI
ncbi:unnamed protein product [Aureobasidium mustum]|uniref:2EXR domain-containing protein n=1 Tax=Aureobasidium mustum TaxID=2773714 RepID=A0A9N8JLN6_9PEZI|nr:unnamed protein product [Aureobasidium mustum]